MDALWQRQTILSTILKTLPADSWSIDDDAFVRRNFTFPFTSQALLGFQSLSRNLSQEEWKRFRRYTARVTTLEVNRTYSCPPVALDRSRVKASLETIQLFGMESQRGSFWPRVRSLLWNMKWEAAPFISSFLTPTITDLDLSFPYESSRFLQPTLSIISHTCRQLQSLTIDGGISGPLSSGEMGRLISASGSTLRNINVRSFTPAEIFPVIFKLPMLRSLRLEEPQFPDEIPLEILPLLEFIGLAGGRNPNLTRFLRGLSAKKLAKIVVYSSEAIYPPPLLGSLTGATATMNYIHLSPVIGLCLGSIALLCTFTNLTSLTIQCVCVKYKPCSFQPTDRDLLWLGRALPHIRTLSLSPGCRIPSQVTFESLIGLSRTCGCLENLSIKIDFASVVEDLDQPNDRNVGPGGHNSQRGRSRLQTLDVGSSPLPDAPRCELVVAVALVSIFPSIDRILFNTDGWGEVWENILVCQKISHITQAESECLSVH